jgi:hypothetical protein
MLTSRASKRAAAQAQTARIVKWGSQLDLSLRSALIADAPDPEGELDDSPDAFAEADEVEYAAGARRRGRDAASDTGADAGTDAEAEDGDQDRAEDRDEADDRDRAAYAARTSPAATVVERTPSKLVFSSTGNAPVVAGVLGLPHGAPAGPSSMVVNANRQPQPPQLAYPLYGSGTAPLSIVPAPQQGSAHPSPPSPPAAYSHLQAMAYQGGGNSLLQQQQQYASFQQQRSRSPAGRHMLSYPSAYSYAANAAAPGTTAFARSAEASPAGLGASTSPRATQSGSPGTAAGVSGRARRLSASEMDADTGSATKRGAANTINLRALVPSPAPVPVTASNVSSPSGNGMLVGHRDFNGAVTARDPSQPVTAPGLNTPVPDLSFLLNQQMGGSGNSAFHGSGGKGGRKPRSFSFDHGAWMEAARAAVAAAAGVATGDEPRGSENTRASGAPSSGSREVGAARQPMFSFLPPLPVVTFPANVSPATAAAPSSDLKNATAPFSPANSSLADPGRREEDDAPASDAEEDEGEDARNTSSQPPAALGSPQAGAGALNLMAGSGTRAYLSSPLGSPGSTAALDRTSAAAEAAERFQSAMADHADREASALREATEARAHRAKASYSGSPRPGPSFATSGTQTPDAMLMRSVVAGQIADHLTDTRVAINQSLHAASTLSGALALEIQKRLEVVPSAVQAEVAALVSQALPATMEDKLRDHLNSHLPRALNDSVSASLARTLPSAIEDVLSKTLPAEADRVVAGRLASGFAGAIDSAIAAQLATSVPSAVQGEVVQSMARHLPGAVEETVTKTLADVLPVAIQSTVHKSMASALPKTVEDAVANRLPSAISAGIADKLSAALPSLRDDVLRSLAGRVQAEVRGQIDAQMPELVDILRGVATQQLPALVTKGMEEVHGAARAAVSQLVQAHLPDSVQESVLEMLPPLVSTSVAVQLRSLVSSEVAHAIDAVRAGLVPLIEETVSARVDPAVREAMLPSVAAHVARATPIEVERRVQSIVDRALSDGGLNERIKAAARSVLPSMTHMIFPDLVANAKAMNDAVAAAAAAAESTLAARAASPIRAAAPVARSATPPPAPTESSASPSRAALDTVELSAEPASPTPQRTHVSLKTYDAMAPEAIAALGSGSGRFSPASPAGRTAEGLPSPSGAVSRDTTASPLAFPQALFEQRIDGRTSMPPVAMSAVYDMGVLAGAASAERRQQQEQIAALQQQVQQQHEQLLSLKTQQQEQAKEAASAIAAATAAISASPNSSPSKAAVEPNPALFETARTVTSYGATQYGFSSGSPSATGARPTSPFSPGGVGPGPGALSRTGGDFVGAPTSPVASPDLAGTGGAPSPRGAALLAANGVSPGRAPRSVSPSGLSSSHPAYAMHTHMPAYGSAATSALATAAVHSPGAPAATLGLLAAQGYDKFVGTSPSAAVTAAAAIAAEKGETADSPAGTMRMGSPAKATASLSGPYATRDPMALGPQFAYLLPGSSTVMSPGAPSSPMQQTQTFGSGAFASPAARMSAAATSTLGLGLGSDLPPVMMGGFASTVSPSQLAMSATARSVASPVGGVMAVSDGSKQFDYSAASYYVALADKLRSAQIGIGMGSQSIGSGRMDGSGPITLASTLMYQPSQGTFTADGSLRSPPMSPKITEGITAKTLSRLLGAPEANLEDAPSTPAGGAPAKAAITSPAQQGSAAPAAVTSPVASRFGGVLRSSTPSASASSQPASPSAVGPAAWKAAMANKSPQATNSTAPGVAPWLKTSTSTTASAAASSPAADAGGVARRWPVPGQSSPAAAASSTTPKPVGASPFGASAAVKPVGASPFGASAAVKPVGAKPAGASPAASPTPAASPFGRSVVPKPAADTKPTSPNPAVGGGLAARMAAFQK